MLLSRKHRFIFIHIYKNAGSSIVNALLPFATNVLQQRLNRLFSAAGISYFDHQPYRDHVTASELVDAMSCRVFRSFFSFGIVRNPWSWQVSQYEYMRKNADHFQHDLVRRFRTFEEYIEWRCVHDRRLQKDFLYSERGEQLVDYIGRYENLNRDFDAICARIGIAASLPRLNVSGAKPYCEYYNEATVSRVREAFAPDIELFGYDFGLDG